MSLACPALIADAAPGLCRAVDHYCERTSEALWAEPTNALSNAAFLVAAWLTWRSLRRDGQPLGAAHALAAIVALVGIGSFTFHTIATRWAELADVIPILIFMLAYLWLCLGRFLGWPPLAKAATAAAFFAATFGLEDDRFDWLLWGGAMYLPSFALLAGLGVAVRAREPAAARAFAWATAVFCVSFAARTLDMPLCPWWGAGTHWLWHVLNGVVLYLLVRIIAAKGGCLSKPARRA